MTGAFQAHSCLRGPAIQIVNSMRAQVNQAVGCIPHGLALGCQGSNLTALITWHCLDPSCGVEIATCHQGWGCGCHSGCCKNILSGLLLSIGQASIGLVSSVQGTLIFWARIYPQVGDPCSTILRFTSGKGTSSLTISQLVSILNPGIVACHGNRTTTCRPTLHSCQNDHSRNTAELTVMPVKAG